MSENKLHLSIDNWLEKLDLLIYVPLLKHYNGVEEILWMSERDLKNIGVNNGSHRARLSSSLAILKDKYEKMSRYSHNFPSPNEKIFGGSSLTHSSSISPVANANFERTHTGVRSWPSTRSSSSHITKHSSPRSSMNGIPGTETTAVELKKALERELSLDSSDLRSHAWYHGTILRQRAEELVTQDGDFLVRDCISQPGDFVITGKWKGVPLHFIIKKIILQPDTIYEKIQYYFEKESFDTIPDFITYYVGSKCPLSENTGVIISRPVNRIMPLSYYESRYGVQCQIHYVAKALENLSPMSSGGNINDNQISNFDKSSNYTLKRVNLLPAFEKVAENENSSDLNANNQSNQPINQNGNLVRVGSDPMLNSNTEKRVVEPRPNSGLFNSDSLSLMASNSADKPPPKPSRVPSKRCSQKPLVLKRERKASEDEITNNYRNAILIPSPSVAHPSYDRQISETRYSFLDRPSVSSNSSTPDMNSVAKEFTIPNLHCASAFNPQEFQSVLLSNTNAPLEAQVLAHIRNILLATHPRILACHLTRVDLEIAQSFEEVDLGVGVTSGFEHFLLPQGEQMQKDLMERTECMKLFVAVLILTAPEEEERVRLINKWIEVAIETKTSFGNFYGFTSIMLGLTLSEILGLQSTWLELRHCHTDNAFVFETKLRPTFKSLHNATAQEAPNTCFPYILSLILIFQQYFCSTNKLIFNSEVDTECLDVDLPGSKISDDYGLQLLADHLEIGRNIMQQNFLFRHNGQMTLKGIKYENVILDMFQTDFHLRMLWGYRGCVVCHEDRHKIFQKVVYSLYQKCLSASP